MIKSMTGYGQSTVQFEDYRITVELKTVNNRYLDSGIKVYKRYSFVEETVREIVSSKISRGKLDVQIQFDNIKKDDNVITLNEDIAKEYYNAVKKMSEILGIEDDITASKMIGFSDIFTIEKKEQDKEKITENVKEVLYLAIEDLTQSRIREGERLKEFFESSLSYMSDIVDNIEKLSENTVNDYRVKIKERVEEYLGDFKADEARLLQEVCMFSDKVNITEEMVRFRSHLKEFKSLLTSDVPVGRKLDFIIQELNRETNTMGSKCNDFEVSKLVVELKSEIEKIREQTQNIE